MIFERTTTALDVAQILRNQILNGQIEEGIFLRQEVVAAEMGVSRVPVREAFAILEAQGLLVREKNRGAYVPRLSRSEFVEIIELIEIFERPLMNAARRSLTLEVAARLNEICDRAHAADHVGQLAILNLDFKRLLFRSAKLPITRDLADILLNRAYRYLRDSRFVDADQQRRWARSHAALLSPVDGMPR